MAATTYHIVRKPPLLPRLSRRSGSKLLDGGGHEQSNVNCEIKKSSRVPGSLIRDGILILSWILLSTLSKVRQVRTLS